MKYNMKRAIIILSCLTGLLLAGCKAEIRSGKTAFLSLDLSSEGEFTEPAPMQSSEAATKADNVDVNTFSFRIYDGAGKEVLGWDRFADVPSVISLEPGTYSLKAQSPGDKAVAWDQPIFKGGQSVSVAAGKTTNVNIVCTIANMKVTVRCTERFISEVNQDFVITVSSKDGVLDFDAEVIAAAKSGFFNVAPLTLDVRATRKTTGAEINHHVEISDVAARDHHVFTVDAVETGYADLGKDAITIDYSVNNKEQDIIIDGLEENPEDNDPVAPVLKSTSIAAGAENVALTVSAVDFIYSVPVKLAQDAAVTINGTATTATVSGNTLTVALGTLEASTAYTVSVPAGAVLNSADNTPAEAAELSFTTADATTEPEPADITMSVEGYNLDAPIVFAKSAPLEVFDLKVTASAGIEQYVVKIMSEALKGLVDGMESNFPGIGAECNYTVDLANMTGSHLGFWGSLFGITEPATQVKGQTAYTLSVGGFLPAMATIGGVGDHVLDITIIDGNGGSFNKVVTFRVTE